MKEFDDLESFGDHLIASAEEYANKRRLALVAIGKHTRDEARRKFGVYQSENGPFDEWEQLALSTQKQREHLGYEPNNPLYRSGDLMNSINYEVDVDSAVVGSDSDIMIYQELGVEENNLPARSVLGLTMFESRADYKKILDIFILAFCTGDKVDLARFMR